MPEDHHPINENHQPKICGGLKKKFLRRSEGAPKIDSAKAELGKEQATV